MMFQGRRGLVGYEIWLVKLKISCHLVLIYPGISLKEGDFPTPKNLKSSEIVRNFRLFFGFSSAVILSYFRFATGLLDVLTKASLTGQKE